MRLNNTLIGSCKHCNKPCIQDSKQMFNKNHTGDHFLTQKSEIKSKINGFIEEVVGDLFKRKSQILKEYFKDLHQRIESIQQRKFRQLNKIKYQIAIQCGQNISKDKIKSYFKYIQSITTDSFQEITCDNVDFLMRGIQRVRRNVKYQNAKVDFEKLNRAIKQTQTEVQNGLQSLTKRHLSRLQKIDEDYQKKLNQKIQRQRERQRQKQKQRQKQRQRQIQKEKVKVRKQPQRSDFKIPLTLISDAPKQSQFNVKITVERVKNVIESKPDKRILFLGRDQSGKIDFFLFKNQNIIEGNTIIVEKCKVKYHNGKKQIGSNCSDKGITLVSQAERVQTHRGGRQPINQRNKKQQQQRGRQIRNYRDEDRPRRNRDQQRPKVDRDEERRDNRRQRERQKQSERGERGDRQAQRGRRARGGRGGFKKTGIEGQRIPQKQQKKQIRKEGRTNYHHQIEQQQIIRIEQIDPDSQDLIVQVKILKMEQNIQGLNCLLGDQTAVVKALLPANWDDAVKGACVRITKMKAQVKNEHIVLMTQKDSKIKKCFKNIDKVNLSKNISDQQWVTQ